MTGKSICIGRRLSSHHFTGSLRAWIDEVSFTWLSLSSHRSSGPCICETLGLRRSGKVFTAKDIPPFFFSQRWCIWAGFRLVFGGCGKWGLTLQNYLELDFNIHWGCKAKNLHFYSLQHFESCLLVTPIFSAFLIHCANDSFFRLTLFSPPPSSQIYDSPLRSPHTRETR